MSRSLSSYFVKGGKEGGREGGREVENELVKKERAREGVRGRLTSITATVRPADVSPSRVA